MSTSRPDGVRGVHVLISGRVQGVWYRAWTAERATELGVDGWVRNLRDGRVEGLFVGPAQAVEALVQACRGGPPLAHVDDIACADALTGALGDEALSLSGAGFHSRPSL